MIWSKKSARFWIFATAILIFTLFQIFAAHNYSQSQRFGDEVGNWIGGHLMTKGLKPYQDVQLNHQPLVYLFSAASETITQPNSLYTYIGRQRMSIAVYAAIWQIMYFLTFGLSGFLFVLVFEIVKYANSGYKLMGETLTVYPLVFMVGIAAKLLLLKKQIQAKHLFLFSVSSFVSIFSLAPLWPTVFLLNAMVLFIVKKDWGKILLLLLPFFVLTILLFMYVPFLPYLRETVTYNLQYLMPVIDRVQTTNDYIKMIALPFTGLFSLKTINGQLVSFFLIAYALLTYRFWKSKKIVIWVIFCSLLVVSNLRVATVGRDNFHLLPYLAAYVFLGVYLLPHTGHGRKNWALLLVIIVWMYAVSSSMFFSIHNLQTEHYNNYSVSQRYGAAVKSIKDDDDRLISLPYDPLVYWIADIQPSIRVLEYYSWVYAIPEYRQELKSVFAKNPPEFVVDAGLNDNGAMDKVVLLSLTQKYTRTSHLRVPSNLYILKKKISEIRKEQWENFAYLLFEKP